MRLITQFLSNNNCFKLGKDNSCKGIMLHSTGANNPYLKRYIAPNDGLLGENTNNNHWNQPQPGGRNVCIHAFIGKLQDGSIASYQTLPWFFEGWHSGNTNTNRSFIGIEICEDGLVDNIYFDKVYKEAVELAAHICSKYNIDPLKHDKNGGIICHSEGAKLGIASNHADVMHWFPKFGKNMDIFRNEVLKTMGGTELNNHTGWIENPSGVWRYLESGKVMMNVWRKDSKGKDYFLGNDGIMVKNCFIVRLRSNIAWWVGSDGAWDNINYPIGYNKNGIIMDINKTSCIWLNNDQEWNGKIYRMVTE